MERLDKYLCDCNLGTRSQVKQLIKAGRISVDSVTVKDGSIKINPSENKVCFDGKAISASGRIVLMMNKPAGFLTATEDSHQQTVMDLLPEEYKSRKLSPIGRLDKDTEGLLLFTDDGELLHNVISPSKKVYKKYLVKHEGTATDADVDAFSDGLLLKDGTKCLPAELEPLGDGESLVTVHEGKYHQVKRMMASRGMHVVHLQRIQEGQLTLKDLPVGAVRELNEKEIDELMSNHTGV